MFDVNKALAELQQKTRSQIEQETAFTWGSRSIACMKLFESTKDFRWFVNACHYRDEAMEHAALADDNGATLQLVDDATKAAST